MGAVVAFITVWSIMITETTQQQTVEQIQLEQEFAQPVVSETELVPLVPLGDTSIQTVSEEALYKCIQVVPDRPMECISDKETCMLVDGKLRFCKDIAELQSK